MSAETDVCPECAKLTGEACKYEGDGVKGNIAAKITGVRNPWCVIERSDGSKYRGVEFRIKPDDGRRAFWTPAMPDQHRRLASGEPQ
jgi:hypothetical protein